MDDRRLVVRLLGLTITTAQARKTFPGIPASAFYAVAPPSDRGRLLTFKAAFYAALSYAKAEAEEARVIRATAARTAEVEERRAAVAAPALDYVSGVVERELAALSASLRARDASPRAVQTIAPIWGRCSRQIGRARARLTKGGGHAEA